MDRTAWSIIVALSLGTGAGCKDSNVNYIGFDAQASDVKADAPASDGSVSDVVSDLASDLASDLGRADGAADSAAAEAGAPDGRSDAADGSDAEPGQ